jgi:outer membrane protein assembly factor BamD (BamD/ComL family)
MLKTFLAMALIFVAWLDARGASLSDAQMDYLFGNYEEALQKAETVKTTDESLYFLGLTYIKTGEYQQGRNYLQKLCQYYPDSRLCSQATLKIADAYFLEKDYDTALEYYHKLQQDYPSFESMPTILLRLAQIASRNGQWDEKNKYLKTIKEKFPQSSESKYASMLEAYGDFFTVQVGAFSEKKNAIALHNGLSQKYKPYVVEDKEAGIALYKVRVGKYKQRYDVEKVAQELLDQGYPARIYP